MYREGGNASGQMRSTGVVREETAKMKSAGEEGKIEMKSKGEKKNHHPDDDEVSYFYSFPPGLFHHSLSLSLSTTAEYVKKEAY